MNSAKKDISMLLLSLVVGITFVTTLFMSDRINNQLNYIKQVESYNNELKIQVADLEENVIKLKDVVSQQNEVIDNLKEEID